MNYGVDLTHTDVVVGQVNGRHALVLAQALTNDGHACANKEGVCEEAELTACTSAASKCLTNLLILNARLTRTYTQVNDPPQRSRETGHV